MVRVLHFVATLGSPGGVQSLLKNYYEKMDHSEVKFDFVVFNNEKCGFEKEFIDMGCEIYYVPPIKEGIIEHFKAINKIFKNNYYDVVHTHQNFRGALTVWLAKKNNIPVRIVHSHRSNAPESYKLRVIRFLMTNWIKTTATHWMACGKDAGSWLFGQKAVEKRRVHILNNAIDTYKYAYSEETRIRLRRELGLEDNFVVGNVGRFYSPKNHELLIRVFKEIHDKEPNSRLLLVGDGELQNKVKQQVEELGLNKFVIFTGARSDVHSFLQVMDVFVLTSTFEGLPVVLVEAQCAGLSCVTGDNITNEMAVTNLITYIPENSTVNEWADTVIKVKKNQRRDMSKLVADSGYYINNEAYKLEKFYRGSLK